MTKFQRYALNKLFWFLVAFFIALIFNFLLPRLIPGNPVDALVSNMAMGGGITGEALARVHSAYIEEFGLDEPMLNQFFTYLGKLSRGDLGTSIALSPVRVQQLIAQSLPWTIALQLPAILVGWTLGNILGAIAAYKKGWLDRTMFPTFLFTSSMPYYCLSIILLYVFAVHFPVFPTRGGYSVSMSPGMNWNFISSVIEHYWLPYLSLVIIFVGGQAIGMRAMSIYEVDADYVRFSHSLGIPDKNIIAYIFRNAMLTQITGLALSIGSLVSGALITEIVFGYPGIGSLLFSSIRQSDYPVIQGLTLIIMMAVLIANFMVDIAYGFIDPRIRAKAAGDR